jgi:hypothetical protein
MTETGFATVENKTKENKKYGESSLTEISNTQIERNRIVIDELLKYRYNSDSHEHYLRAQRRLRGKHRSIPEGNDFPKFHRKG